MDSCECSSTQVRCRRVFHYGQERTSGLTLTSIARRQCLLSLHLSFGRNWAISILDKQYSSIRMRTIEIT
jgi:hypothetical protein